MKRSRKTLFALLLALVMTLGLTATAWASEGVPTDTSILELTITKMVEQTGDVAPPVETFTFVLEDVVNKGETKRDLAYYGIELLDDLTISTATGNTVEKTLRFKLPASDFAKHHWNPSRNSGSEDIARYRKVFLLTEKNDGKAGWVYSTKSYELVFTYDIEDKDLDLDVYLAETDARESAKFTNTYTENLRTVEIPFTKTVKLGGNTAPGKTDFTIAVCDVNAHDLSFYPNVKYTTTVTTTGAGDYVGKLIISGPATQVDEFISEGFYVREEKGSLSGWTYSDAVWFVKRVQLESGSQMQIYPAKMEKTANGEFYDVINNAAAVGKMTFENTYTYSTTPIRREKPNTPEPAIASPKTFDAGVALYGVSALLSLAGTALVIKRKNG
mgnify:CR=1 FL=1